MANSDYKVTGHGSFAPVAELSEAVDYLDTVFKLKGYNLPNSDSLRNGMAAMIEEEIVLVTAYGVGQCTVKRGCADTVPAQHPVDALVWWLDGVVGYDGVEYAGGEEVAVKQTPYTIGGGKLPMASAPPDDLKMNWRFFRPYAPGLLMARTDHWFVPQAMSSTDPELTLTWKDRDRVVQADQLVDHLFGNIGPEPGTSYTARVYNANQDLVRTEVGIIGTGSGASRVNSWTYQWSQAVIDLGLSSSPTGDIVTGYVHFCSNRQSFDSWQDYTIQIEVDTAGNFMRVAQFSTMAAQPTEEGSDEVVSGMMVSQMSEMVAQEPAEDGTIPDTGTVSSGMMVAALQESAGQLTSFYTVIQRNLFEAPYTYLARLGQPVDGAFAVTVAARPSDRLTDNHVVRARPDWPQGAGSVLPYNTVATPNFTPWITLKVALQFLETTAVVRTSSFFDGVPIFDVPIGTLALLNAEVVRVDGFSSDGEFVMLGRGCCDTVPAKHAAGSRLWFFEYMSGFDASGYPWNPASTPPGAAVQIKLVPNVYGPPLMDSEIPTDRLTIKRRVQRPLPPGRVVVNNRPWFEGAQAEPETTVRISWVGRDRITQGDQVFDHSAQDQGVENLQQHRLRMQITIRSTTPDTPPTVVTIRDVILDGNSFEYTYEMAQADGYKVGRLLGACGHVSAAFALTSIREDISATVAPTTNTGGYTTWTGADGTKKFGYESWQGYSILIRLPSYVCPPGQPPGGGQQGGGNGLPDGGNGEPGTSTPTNPGSGHDDPAKPLDPIDNSGGGDTDNGGGPPEPPEPPPDWPDPVDPTPQPGPDDPNPELSAHWDTNWDRHWDAYQGDDIGGPN